MHVSAADGSCTEPISSVPVTVSTIKEKEPRKSRTPGRRHALCAFILGYLYGCAVGLEVEASQGDFLLHLSFNPLEEPLFKPR